MENVTYKQLILLPEQELTDGQKLFLEVHDEIMNAGRKAAEYAIIVANDLKRMQDEQLYKEAGFPDFKSYVEATLNIKERQAYSWISILALPPEWLIANADLGITKLAAIAAASSDVKEELMNNEEMLKNDDGSSLTVRQLNEKIKTLEEWDAQKVQQLNLLDVENKKLCEQNKKLTQTIEDMEQSIRVSEDVVDAAREDAEKAEAEAAAAKKREEEATAKVTALQKQLEETQKQKTKTKTVEKTVDNPELVKELDAAKKAAEEARQAAEKATTEAAKLKSELEGIKGAKQASKAAEEAVAGFKVYFKAMYENYDKCMGSIDAIAKVDEELAKKCKAKVEEFAKQIWEG